MIGNNGRVRLWCIAASSVSKPTTPQITRAYDLADVGTEVWVGATGATGVKSALQRVLGLRMVVQ